MTTVTRSLQADMEGTSAIYAPRISDLIAGEDLNKAAPCRIDPTDGMVYMSNASAADANATLDGFTPRPVKAGQPVTLFGVATRFRYSDGNLTPGQMLYLGTADGELDDAPTTGDADGVAKAINTSDIRIIRDH